MNSKDARTLEIIGATALLVAVFVAVFVAIVLAVDDEPPAATVTVSAPTAVNPCVGAWPPPPQCIPAGWRIVGPDGMIYLGSEVPQAATTP